jgi:hypothetical protein
MLRRLGLLGEILRAYLLMIKMRYLVRFGSLVGLVLVQKVGLKEDLTLQNVGTMKVVSLLFGLFLRHLGLLVV